MSRTAQSRSRTKKSAGAPARLRAYHRKRDLAASGEPGGRRAAPRARPSEAPLTYVIQKHDARRLHYDLRLEMEGVYKSWAVPKGLPTRRGEKSLAVEVEDHPLDYGSFEGVIPPGNYGAGTVMVWDRGHYVVAGGNALEAFRSGKIHFALAGEKCTGEWTLVRMRHAEDDKTNWLLFKTGETRGRTPVKAAGRERSVQSGRTLDEIAREEAPPETAPERITSGKRGSQPGAKAPPTRTRARSKTAPSKGGRTPRSKRRKKSTPTGGFVEPMKALASTTLPAGEWLLEVKFDGYRAIAVCHGEKVQLWSRNRELMNADFPEVVDALQKLDCDDAVFDGEIAALDESGRSSFQLLQRRKADRVRAPIVYYVFDLLHLDGASLLDEPIEKRQAALARVLNRPPSGVRRSPVFDVPPQEMLRQVKRQGLEGLIAKRPGSRYESGRRSGTWIKHRIARGQEFVIGGYTPPGGSRTHLGALLLGYYAGGELRFAGKVGTGFNRKTLEELDRNLAKHRRPSSPFVDLPGKDRAEARRVIGGSERDVTWLEPAVVCEVRFSEWTQGGRLRQPVYLGLRRDKTAKEVVREPQA